MKAHGTGNDFVVLADLEDAIELGDELVRALCDRHFGVGADGVIRIAPGTDAPFFMDYRNADGSRAEMCGNGVRVVGKYLGDRGIVAGDAFDLETRGGVKHLALHRRDGVVERVTVDMGRPDLSRAALGVAGEGELRDEPIDAAGSTWRMTGVSMGNPHVVTFVADVDTAPVATVGPLVETNPMFGAKTNVEFVERVDGGHLRQRTWERGVGETLACGTGACAVTVASHLRAVAARGPRRSARWDARARLDRDRHGADDRAGRRGRSGDRRRPLAREGGARARPRRAALSGMRTARRIAAIPPYLFAEIDRNVAARRAAGVDVISFGVGDPDLPTPDFVVEELARAAHDPSTHQYPSYFGLPALREAIAAFYDRRFGVRLDPTTQVLPLIGSKEGIAHLPWAYVDPGDPVLVTEPGYPVYEIGTILAGGEPVHLRLTAEGGWFPDFSAVDPRAADRAKILWLGYPSNPTAAVAELGQFEQAVRFAADHDVLLAHDAAYSEITYDGFVAPSVLEVPGALDVAVEFGSLSKIFNMTGWRCGWVVGNADAIEALGRVKTNIDSGIFNAVQRAGVAALTSDMAHLPGLVATYQRRRDRIIEVFKGAGWEVEPPKGALYVWLPTPAGESSVAFTARLLDEAGVVVAPGTG